MNNSISKVNIILSTPNNRGIHRYSNSLLDIMKINPPYYPTSEKKQEMSRTMPGQYAKKT